MSFDRVKASGAGANMLRVDVHRRSCPRDREALRIGHLAALALWQELALFPKPGLVSLQDRGSHRDMDAFTFVRSLVALRPWFVELAAAGMRSATFAELRRIGIRAETAMLTATGGINTHRGAIFTLGLLAAGAGTLRASTQRITDSALRAAIARHWGGGLAGEWRPKHAASHGVSVERRYGASGARGEAVHGFPAIFDVALPTLRDASSCGADRVRASLASFVALLACVDDTNVLYRAGPDGLGFVQRSAREYLRDGRALDDDALERAAALHRAFVARRISPGGCADLLAGALFVHALHNEAHERGAVR